MDPTTAYLLLGAALVAVPAYVLVMEQLSSQAHEDAFWELMEEVTHDPTE